MNRYLLFSLIFLFFYKSDAQTGVDNANIHKAKIIQEQIKLWENRGLYIFYIPPYSPHLNIAETLWRKIKKEQIDPLDYLNKETLFYAVNRCLAQLGKYWKINFSNFNIN